MVTIKEVAKDAGVSVGTVSNVINGVRVSEERRLRVEASIEKLGYQVNTLARGLKTRKTDYVVVILPNLINPFFSLLLASLEKALVVYHKQIVLCISDGDTDKELHFIQLASRNKIDGIIGVTYTNLDYYLSDGMAFVSIDRHFNNDIHVVAADNYTGGRMAAEELYKRGSRNMLSFQTRSSLNTEVQRRQLGFEAWCSEHNVSCSSNTFSQDHVESVYSSFSSKELIANVLHAYLGGTQNANRIDGIFASSDHLALVICDEIRRLGLRIPEDVQVIGFDGLRTLNQGDPIVSTIEQPIDLIAETAVQCLFRILNEETFDKVINLPVRFLEGWSTRPLEIRDADTVTLDQK